MFRKLTACPAGGCVLALPSAVGWVAEHECGSAVSMPSNPRPSAVDADMRRQHLNAEPLWPSLITMIRSRWGLTPRWPRCKRAQTWRVCQRHPGWKWRQRRKQRLVTRGMIRCAQSGLASSRSRAQMPPHLGAAPRPGLTQKASAWLHAFPLLPLQIQGLDSGQGCQRTAIPRQHKTERDAAVERNCVGRQERRALGAALACTAAGAEFRARCAQKGLCLGGTSAPL